MPRGKSARTLALIAAAQRILAEIQPATVRAVCYRLFVEGQLGSMKKTETNRVSQQLTWAREQRIIPWEWIVDETRAAERVNAWTDPESYVRAVQRSYRRDYWALQPYRCEIWSEKGTVRGTLGPVQDALGFTFRVMHGYASATALNEVAQESRALERPLRVFYVGDWDPSGLHMSEVDLPTRLDEYGAFVMLERVALAWDDILTGGLPSFETDSKRSDSRWAWYRGSYGPRCWELDALSPVLLRERVQRAVEALIDRPAWERCLRAEAAERESLQTILSGWRTA